MGSTLNLEIGLACNGIIHGEPPSEVMVEIARILRVDHAGETGAIQIYRAQIFLSRLLYPDIVPILAEMLEHEQAHQKVFSDLLRKRGIRTCYALRLWSLGGYLLGVITSLLGRNSIWVCTNAIESTVLLHLKEQISFLRNIDSEAYSAVCSIKSDEESHQQIGMANQNKGLLSVLVIALVKYSTTFAIWLSIKL
ncbi:demethoxyubiquinone hydroxylase family protein [Ketobacter sp.]|uniref:demethoxyubiquinone hydroxylase family protein n=1 Tax=Ketobacter sp. TaxID=2083498 RepID=UPI000F2A8776|nr:demethoxyubiquinone hydroxylase family protein [Ketobacter sp.]RLU01216.1 MAG: demethoxyubiquinone hydroxylase family protein [Ketobacter sp.]